ncbi:SpoIIE family protein phosphatase [Peribacillus muralis]|uniref:SpoIIE family protein phosphatase n=1 Tax=Peribacillus muralis TaxID=264697 RepID=UPI003D066D1B
MNPLIIPDITKSELSKNLNITRNLGTGSFIGIPIYFGNGDNYGTICGLDTESFVFTKDHIDLFETMASLLTYVLDLDESHKSIQALLSQRKKQEEILNNDLDMAYQVQKSLLSIPLNEENIQIEASHVPSFKLAGDSYYWYKIDDHRYAIILIDIMGHGISASLVCMYISTVLRETVQQVVDPELVIQELNRYMASLPNSQKYVSYYFTAIYMVIDTDEKTVEYVNSGHPPGIAFVDGAKEVLLEGGSPAIGFFEQIQVKKTIIRYINEIQLMLYTDGLIEANIPNEGEFMNKLHLLTSQKWEQFDTPISYVLPEKKLVNQTDDITIIMIKAK